MLIAALTLAVPLAVPLAVQAAVPAPPPSATGLWNRSVDRVQAAAAKAKPSWTKVGISIDRSMPGRALVGDPGLGLDLEVSQLGWGTLSVGGYLSGSIMLRDPRLSWAGVDLMGGGVNVGISPFGMRRFLLNGLYKNEDGSDGSLSVSIEADGLPLRDLEIHQKGLDLTARWQASGYVIKGKADSKVYGKRELAIISAALSGLTFDSFRP